MKWAGINPAPTQSGLIDLVGAGLIPARTQSGLIDHVGAGLIPARIFHKKTRGANTPGFIFLDI